MKGGFKWKFELNRFLNCRFLYVGFNCNYCMVWKWEVHQNRQRRINPVPIPDTTPTCLPDIPSIALKLESLDNKPTHRKPEDCPLRLPVWNFGRPRVNRRHLWWPGPLRSSLAVWCSSREGIKDGGQRKQKYNLRPSALFKNKDKRKKFNTTFQCRHDIIIKWQR